MWGVRNCREELLWTEHKLHSPCAPKHRLLGGEVIGVESEGVKLSLEKSEEQNTVLIFVSVSHYRL